MKLHHIDLQNLKPSPLNVRKHGNRDVSDLVISIRSLGLLQPLLVRKNCEGYEVIAGQRRLKACQLLAAEAGQATPAIPCAELEEGDDAAAIEASLAENIARLPMDEIDQYQAFAALVKEGRSVDDIAGGFGVTERLVRQRLAIANLLPTILTLFPKDEIGGDTMRSLTLATKVQQKAWLKRFRDPEDYAPQGRALRQWLLGGEQIATSAALFPLEEHSGAIIADLFGEEAYFSDAEAFWPLQMKAVAEAADAYRAKGWREVVVMEAGAYWHSYAYRRVPKKEGGKVFVAVRSNGEVTFHEGYLFEEEARRKQAAQEREQNGDSAEEKAVRPELTKAALNYADLHRHAAVRAALVKEPGIALRVSVAHAIAGSALWRVTPEPQRAEKQETAESLAASLSEAVFAEERRAVLALLGLDDEETEGLTGRMDVEVGAVFAALLTLEDADVLRILALVMAETLSAGTALIDTLGSLLAVDMGAVWQADDALLSLIRDREVLHPMLAHTAGKVTADAHAASPAKTLRSIIRQCVSGEGRAKVEGWVPRFMAFPATGYTARGGVPQSA